MPASETRRTYEAEFLVRDMLDTGHADLHGRRFDFGVERRFASLENVQDYVQRVLNLNWLRAAYPAAANPLRVVRSRVINKASCGSGILNMNNSFAGKWQMRELVLLHEIAHHLTPYEAHTAAFRTCFAHLVEEIMSPEAALALRTGWWDLGLAVHPAPSMA